jgi:protein involved in polysaccharide export with SLBB domain
MDMLTKTNCDSAPNGGSENGRLRTFGFRIVILLAVLASTGREARAQSAPGQLVSRAELTAGAIRADSAARVGAYGSRARNAMLAAAIHQRLRDGDFKVGDRVIVTIVSDAIRKDTLAVRPGPLLELPGKIVVPIGGVLRSELRDRVSNEVLKYIKAQQIEVTPLMRVGVLGEVTRPGFFAFASDIPLTDAIMGAGGPTGGADLERSIVRRGNLEYHSADETRKAIATGLTLDQFGLNAGDELVIGRHNGLNPASIIGSAGALASVIALFITLRHR